MLRIAKEKQYAHRNVKFGIADIYQLPASEPPYDAGFGGFIRSHIPLSELPIFLSSFHQCIKENGRVVFVDNRYVPGNSTPLAEEDAEGNTYQLRKLQSGEEHRVLKNYPFKSDLRSVLKGCAFDIQIKQLTYFWALTYSVSASK